MIRGFHRWLLARLRESPFAVQLATKPVCSAVASDRGLHHRPWVLVLPCATWSAPGYGNSARTRAATSNEWRTGETIEVTQRGHLVAWLVPAAADPWAAMVAAGERG